MKKQIVVALALAITSFSFSQKKELRKAEKAVDGNNYAEAKTLLKQVSGMLPSMDQDLKAKYHYLMAAALYANGTANDSDIKSALSSLSNVEGDYEKESLELRSNMLQSFLTKGNKAYEGKAYGEASKYFENAYRVSSQDTLYLYNSAIMAVTVQDYDRALDLYGELRDIGYVGVQYQYFAVNKETGEEEMFASKDVRDVSVKTGSHIKPTEKQTEPKNAEIVKNIALIYIEKGEKEKALEAMRDARASNPDDLNLLLSEANLHLQLDNKKEFQALLQEATKRDPNNAELQFNLGVIAQESGDVESAKKYYQKAIELDPNFNNAQINMAALLLSREESIIEEMNGLGSSAADNKRYDELQEERIQLFKSAIPYLETVLNNDPDNIGAAQTLMNIYSAIGDTAKYKAMKAKVESMGN
ncbi:tetratricopeptide repeat protein [Mangrovimonas spongiae]|uniref:Tetratricopeptide repeat protein n=1 Tax=Mangrovimonas spongiae TaxID=2494697 RepID=A0A3R9N449_9FLAO|nr:tetratricopeptide repeat protein [Mangrovimonas spongiae]RSK38565.1 tetratricopeptide repeat protein [Mangrovimonas spongiae]